MNLFESIKDHLKTYCPKCKYEIFKNAHVCPWCGYDLNSSEHQIFKNKERSYIRNWGYFCLAIFIISLINGENFAIDFILCFLLFGLGVYLITKFSKFRNFFH
jgi:hypothetical protein